MAMLEYSRSTIQGRPASVPTTPAIGSPPRAGRRALAWAPLFLLASGCTLITDVDRSLIPQPVAPSEDAGGTAGSSADASTAAPPADGDGGTTPPATQSDAATEVTDPVDAGAATDAG